MAPTWIYTYFPTLTLHYSLPISAYPSNLDLKSERSTQWVLGYSRHLRQDLWFSAEGYYQQLDDLIVFDDRTTNTATNIGEGSATGVDLMLARSEEHTSELQSLSRISYAVFCLKKKKPNTT